MNKLIAITLMKKITLLLFFGITYTMQCDMPPQRDAKKIAEMETFLNEYLGCSIRQIETLKDNKKYMAQLEIDAKKTDIQTEKLSRECKTTEDLKTCKDYVKAENFNKELKRRLGILKFGIDPEMMLAANFVLMQIAAMEQQAQ